MSQYNGSYGGGGGSGGGAIAEDLYFADIAARDAFTTNNPDRLYQGLVCAVVNGSAYDYYEWDETAGLWRDANRIFQGHKGDTGDTGKDGEKGDTVKITAVTNSLDPDDKLVTKVELDDGTSAESPPLALPDNTGITVDGKNVTTVEATRGIAAEVTGTTVTIRQDVSFDVWDTRSVTVLDTPFVIAQQSQAGIDYVCDYQNTDAGIISINLTTVLAENTQIRVSLENTTPRSNVVQVFGTDFNWHFSTPTLLSVRNGKWRVEESSQMLSMEGATTYAELVEKRPITAITIDPDSDLTSKVTAEGILVLGRIKEPSVETVDIAFWWSDNAEPSADDILVALSQIQSENVVSHTDNFTKTDLQVRSLSAKRDESTFKYAYFAWPAGFFSPEPTKIDTGFGGPSTWIPTTRVVDSVTYNILTVEIVNNSQSLDDYTLVQEGKH